MLELIVDGVFAMDSAHTATEQALAAHALARLPQRPLDIMIGGLGLGYTGLAVLSDPRVRRLTVIELHAALVDWIHAGLVPAARGLLDDPRVEIEIGDVLDAVPALPPHQVDALLLDVDNGPGFLVHQGNAGVYAAPFLAAAARALRPDGVLAIWSADPSPGLARLIEQVCGRCEEVLQPVSRDGHRFDYALYLGRSDSGGFADQS